MGCQYGTRAPSCHMLSQLRALFSDSPRIGLTGCAGAGKTTLARELLQSGAVPGLTLVSGDDTVGMGWSRQPLAVIEAAERAGRVLVDWVQVPRAVRKGLQLDLVYVLPMRGNPTQRQRAQWQGQLNILSGLSVPVVRAPGS